MQFFETTMKALLTQQTSFAKMVRPNNDKSLLMASLEMSHVVLRTKRPYTELEEIVLPGLKIAAERIHGGDAAVKNVEKIPISDTSTRRRCKMVANDLKEQLY